MPSAVFVVWSMSCCFDLICFVLLLFYLLSFCLLLCFPYLILLYLFWFLTWLLCFVWIDGWLDGWLSGWLTVMWFHSLRCRELSCFLVTWSALHYQCHHLTHRRRRLDITSLSSPSCRRSLHRQIHVACLHLIIVTILQWRRHHHHLDITSLWSSSWHHCLRSSKCHDIAIT